MKRIGRIGLTNRILRFPARSDHRPRGWIHFFGKLLAAFSDEFAYSIVAQHLFVTSAVIKEDAAL